ncbi:tetratricopeptide repeat protein [Aequorivita sp. F47161]|uniref:Tetratricopeptide repeat protein n=1 Tax=Aequorivita vitellina TaxID=2874475 RepID=A0A9X1UAR3_9FLAO|nr:tetratricopeptide repeat protein [Aequorivita vitellina]MCG2419871.1 tetratricopeptide repeat protein [Aequorivita vitellina]
MKHFCLPIFLLFLSSSLLAQNDKIAELETEIQKYLFKQPDSAKIYLFKLLEYSQERDDTLVALTYSKLGITYSQLAIYDSSSYYFKKGIALADESPTLKADLYANSAINYRNYANYPQSLAALKQAMEIYQEYGDRSGEGVVYGEMASNYNYMGEKEKAITNLKRAIEIFKEIGDERLYILQQKLANTYYNTGNYEFAVDLYEQVLPRFAEDKAPSYYLTLLSYAESLVELGNIKEGEKRLLEAKEGLTEKKNLEYMYVAWGKLGNIYKATNRPVLAKEAYSESFNYLQKSQSPRFLQIASDYLSFLNAQKDYNTAIRVIERVKNSTNNFELAMNAQDKLSFLLNARETYRNTKQFEKSLNLFDRIDYLKDSMQSAIDRVKIKQLEESYQNKFQRDKNIALQNSNEMLKRYNTKQRTITILSWLLTALILILSILIFMYNKKRLALQKVAVANLEKANSVLKENQELEQELLAEKENNLADKERELVAISLEVADIQKQIKDIIQSSDKNEVSEEFAERIVSTLNQLNYWKHFKTKFVEVHPEFGYNLEQMFPNLTEDDIAFCSLLKLQLSTEEITSLMGITKEKVAATKHRIKAKMHLQDNDEDFEKLMREL